MPLYDYDCAACGHRVEVMHGVYADGPGVCPHCGSDQVRKAFAAPAVHFKGSGWAKKERRSTSPSGSRAATSDGQGGGDGGGSESSGGESSGGESSGNGSDRSEAGSSGGTSNGGDSGSADRDGSRPTSGSGSKDRSSGPKSAKDGPASTPTSAATGATSD